MYSINSFSLTKLNNAEFVGYCVNVSNLMERAEATKLGLEQELMELFVANKAKLIDQVYTSAKSQYTDDMKACDEKRDKIVKRVLMKFQIISLAESGSSMLQFKPAVDAVILSKYSTSLTTKPQHEESAIIQGLVHDARTTFSEDDLNDMQLSNDLTNLESANQEFIAAYANRADERAAGDTRLTLRLRGEMIDILTQIYNTVQYYANSSLEANATKATACQAFIATLNVTLGDVKKRWNQRTGGEEPGTSNDGPNGPTPDPSLPEEGSGNQSGSGAGGSQSGSGAGGNAGGNGSAIDHENGTVHDGEVEF